MGDLPLEHLAGEPMVYSVGNVNVPPVLALPEPQEDWTRPASIQVRVAVELTPAPTTGGIVGGPLPTVPTVMHGALCCHCFVPSGEGSTFVGPHAPPVSHLSVTSRANRPLQQPVATARGPGFPQLRFILLVGEPSALERMPQIAFQILICLSAGGGSRLPRRLRLREHRSTVEGKREESANFQDGRVPTRGGSLLLRP